MSATRSPQTVKFINIEIQHFQQSLQSSILHENDKQHGWNLMAHQPVPPHFSPIFELTPLKHWKPLWKRWMIDLYWGKLRVFCYDHIVAVNNSMITQYIYVKYCGADGVAMS